MRSPSLASIALLLWLGGSSSLGGQTYQVLMVGDSWAEQMWTDQSLRTIFANQGHPEILDKGDVTAISGSTAAEWSDPAWLDTIATEIAEQPSIEVVHLSIGGNDFLAGAVGGGWSTGMGSSAWQSLKAQIAADIATVIDFILALDPALEVVLSSYDYTNFEASVGGGPSLTCQLESLNLGSPTPEQINSAALELTAYLELQVLDPRPRARGVGHFGWMQYTYGFPLLGIDPGQLAPPGDISLPSPVEAMRDGDDCFHLTPDGYLVVAQNLWDQAYEEILVARIFVDGFESGDTISWSASLP